MFVVGLLSWWYGAGWKARLAAVRERIARTYDYFSIDLLLGTLFAPFRQISAGRSDGPLAMRWRAFVDRLVSRCIGAVMRLFLIVFGIVTIVLVAIIGVVLVVLWACVPLMPLIGAVLAIIGWVPSWM